MPKKPIPEMTDKELEREALEGLNAQQTDLDKVWYYLNYQAMYGTAKSADHLAYDPSINVDEVFDTREEYDAAVEKERSDHPEKYFQQGEREKIQVPWNYENLLKLENSSKSVYNELKTTTFHAETMDAREKTLKLFGQIQAKIAVELGKAYEKKLQSIPADDPDREEKAEYLQRRDVNGKESMLYRSFKDMEDSYLVNIGAFSAEMTQNSPVRDIETLKNVTLGEFLDASYMDAEDQQLFFEDAAQKGIPANRDTNAFEYFKKEIDAQQSILKAMNPDREKRKPLDQEVLYIARENYLKNLTISLPKFSMTAVSENMSDADKKLFDQGAKLMSRKYYRTPEKLRDWAKETADKELVSKRADDLNRNFTDFCAEADKREPYDLENDPLYKKSFGKHLGEQASEYEKFLHEHLGMKALIDPPEKRREHLALAAAANDFYAKDPEHFNLAAVVAEAKNYRSFDMFNNLSDQEVSKLLVSREASMKTLHVMAAKKYGVPESERAEYIRKMKALSEAMVPSDGQSEKYKDMKNAVDAIAALDPQDPGLETKLLKANVQLYNRVFKYEKGKKSVRTFKTSQARFDNSLDVLSVVNDHVPGLRKHVQKIVDRTNEVRKAEPGDNDYVDLAAYGQARAEKNAPKTSAFARKNAAAEADRLMEKAGLNTGEKIEDSNSLGIN